MDTNSAQHPVTIGVLLVGHGSRDEPGVAEFLATVRRVERAAPQWAVEPCFLEFASPSIDEGFSRLAARRVERVVVAPVILLSAGHVRRDIPREVAQAAARFPHIAVVQADHLGCHASLVELSQRRYDEAIANRSPDVAPQETVLVMAGRGSREAAAIEEMRRFVRLREDATPAREVRTAFLSMAEPSLADALDQLARDAPRRVVVQPHLLFSGRLLDRTEQTVHRVAENNPRTDWAVAAQLGESDLLVAALLDRAAAACGDTAARH